MSDDVFLKFQYEERDLADAVRLRLASVFRGRLDLPLAAVVCAVGLVLIHEFAPAWMWRLAAWLMGIAAGAIVAILAWALRVVPGATFRKNAELAQPRSVDASEEGITITVGEKFATIKWRNCTRFESDRRLYALYHGEKGVLLVPRRVFRSEAQDRSFQQLLARLVPEDRAEA